VLSAVAHAHSNLIVHRDIKPPNILVTDDGVVKLLDFGIAGLLSPDDEAPTSLTRNTAVGLTPGYAAPEQLLGETITTATDVYALGLVLFVLLAGRHPVSLQGKSNAELIRLTLETDPLRLSDATDNVRKGRVLRGDLDNIVAMALRRNPLERYPSAESFAQDLRRYLALEPVMAQPPSLRYLASKFVQRNWRSLAWGIAFAAVLMSAVAVTTSEMVAARRQRDEARFQARRAEASNEFMNVLMLSGNGSQSALTFDERVQLGVDLLDKQYRDDPHFAGRMLADLASEVRDNNEIGRANELFDRAYEMGRRTDDAELMVDALCARVYGDAIADIREGVMERIAEAQRLLTGIRHPDSMLQAQCLQAQGRFEQSRGNTVTAEALLQNAMRIVEESGNTHHVIYSMVLTDLGEVYLARNQLREVLRITQLIGEIQERNGRGGTSARLMVRQNAAIALISMGEVRAALTEREIINQRVRELESPGQEPFAYAINYAALLRRMARPAEALSALDGVLERLRRSGDPFILTQELLNLGATLTQLGRWDEADAALEEAASLVGNGNGNKSLAAQIEANQSRLGLARGDLQLAHRHRGRALELAGYHTAKPQRSLAQVLIVAADVALAERNAIEAESFARDALAIFESVARGPTTSADVGEALLRLAKARALSGVRAGTKVLLERAVECLTNGLGASHPLTIESRALLAGASV
jgi:serine/threonine-protein kinase